MPHGVEVFIWLQLLTACTPLVCGQVFGTLDTTDDSENTINLPVGIKLRDGDTHDYIVVGAGAAGCAVAARLALLGFDVLLVEAGGDPNLISKIPSLSMALLGSDMDWQYKSIPNNVSCLASRGRQCRFSRGKCLGGSSSINYMLYTRGNRYDYDYNITNWNWEDLKPYFLRYEGLQVLDQLPESLFPYHNTTGIMKMNFFDSPQNPWHSRIIRGFRSLNFPYNIDVNGKSQIGVSKLVGFVHKGERMSTARAYLQRKGVQRNLRVAKDTLCTGVIIDDRNITRGVTVLPKMKKKQLRLYARKEVILSAGTIGTPQILMLSGIGPSKHLHEMGIPLRVDLPVGDNMSDHVLPIIIILVDRDKVTNSALDVLTKIGQLAQFLVRGSGPFASNGLTDVNTFANTFCYDRKRKQLTNESNDCELPNLQVIPSYIEKNLISLIRPAFEQGLNLRKELIDQVATANKKNAFIILANVLLTPYSRGYIRLASSDPLVPPAIVANYLSDSRDVDLMVRSIKIVEDLVQTPEFKRNNAEILRLKFPGCPSFEKGRKLYWQCYVRHMTYSGFHAVGTCSLNQVVDVKLQVKGVQGLRVADASIIPTVPRGNSQAVAVAVGERVVDFIKETLRTEDT